LGVFDGGEELILPDAVAFLDVDMGKLTHGVGADIDVSLGLHFAGGGDDAG